MSLGNSTFSIQTGGGQVRASSQSQARAIVHLACSPKGTPNTLIPIGDAAGIPALLDTGEAAEVAAFTAKRGQPQYVVVVNPTTPGAVSAVTQVGSGTGTCVVTVAPHRTITILCTLGGVIGVSKVKFSLDGGVTYGPEVLTAATIRIPGTYCTLAFAAATYVATKTCTVDIFGVVTNGSGWVGVVTISSASPIDDYEVVVTVTKAGALGVAVVQISLDGGNSTLPTMLLPSGGVIGLQANGYGTGLVLTFASTFVLGDTYSFLTIGPDGSTSDYQAALTAAKAVRTLQASMIHAANMPASAAGAISLAATVDASVLDAFQNNIFDWEAACNVPSKFGGMRVVSPLTGRKHLRPLSWLAMDRYAETDPKDELAATQPDASTATGDGSLRIFIVPGSTTISGPGDIVMPSATPLYDTADTDAVIVAARGADLSGRTSLFAGGRDEALTPGLDDVQINTARTYGGAPLKAFLSITAGVIGWKNLTTNASYIDAGAVRALNAMVSALRSVQFGLLGQRPKVNLDGTISEEAARTWDTLVDGAVKRATGLKVGGDFAKPQASFASASILRTSQLGQNPKRLDIAYTFQPLGEVTQVSGVISFSGVVAS
jgi:hypothetical protein